MSTDKSNFFERLKNIPPCPDHPKPKYSGCSCMHIKLFKELDKKKETN